MLRGAIFAVAVLMAVPAYAGQTADEAYEACLIGHSTLGVLQSDLPPPVAYDRAVDLCADVANTVPADFCPGESCGAGAVEEAVIHYFESVVVPALTGYTIYGEPRAEY